MALGGFPWSMFCPRGTFCSIMFDFEGAGAAATKGPSWGHSKVVLGAIRSLLEPFYGHLAPKIDKVSEELTLRYPHEEPCAGRGRGTAALRRCPISTFAFIFLLPYIYMYAPIYVFTYTYIYIVLYVYIYEYIYIYVYIHINIYIYMLLVDAARGSCGLQTLTPCCHNPEPSTLNHKQSTRPPSRPATHPRWPLDLPCFFVCFIHFQAWK